MWHYRLWELGAGGTSLDKDDLEGSWDALAPSFLLCSRPLTACSASGSSPLSLAFCLKQCSSWALAELRSRSQNRLLSFKLLILRILLQRWKADRQLANSVLNSITLSRVLVGCPLTRSTCRTPVMQGHWDTHPFIASSALGCHHLCPLRH